VNAKETILVSGGEAITAASSNATLTAVHAGLSSILVYPNPTADRIYIKTEKTFNAELFDLTGRKIQQTKQKQLDMSSLSSGAYILNVTTENNKIQSFKILKK
tara:strand:+ start:311 stop:619 length:309 start_codon:yes stop_codon:yes gene_type:complete